MSVINVKNVSEFKAQALDADVPVVVDFYADWCGPCVALAPNLESLSKKYDGKLKVVKVNVDHNPELAQQFQVRGIPALFFLKGGQMKARLTGNQPVQILENEVLKLL